MNIVSREFLKAINQKERARQQANSNSMSRSNDSSSETSSSNSHTPGNSQSSAESKKSSPQMPKSRSISAASHEDELAKNMGDPTPKPRVFRRKNEFCLGRILRPVLRTAKTRAEFNFEEQPREDFMSQFRVLQKEIRNRKNNVMAFERATNDPSEVKPVLKRNNSEMKLAKSTREVKMNFNEPLPQLIPTRQELKLVDRRVSQVGESMLEDNRSELGNVATSVKMMATLKIAFQPTLMHGMEDASGPSPNKRKRDEKFAAIEELKKGVPLLDKNTGKHEFRLFNFPNPNKPKVFEFKREELENQTLEEKTLINLDQNLVGHNIDDIISSETFPNSIEVTVASADGEVYIFKFENAELLYVRKDTKIEQFIQTLIHKVYYRYSGRRPLTSALPPPRLQRHLRDQTRRLLHTFRA